MVKVKFGVAPKSVGCIYDKVGGEVSIGRGITEKVIGPLFVSHIGFNGDDNILRNSRKLYVQDYDRYYFHRKCLKMRKMN